MKIVSRTTLALFLLAFSLSSIAQAADSKNLEGTPQAKAYRAMMKTVAAGDFEGYKKHMTKASLKMMDQQMAEMKMDSKKAMEMMQMLSPTDIKITAVNVDKNKATLLATGMMDKEANKGTIEMEQEDGQWKMTKQSWTNAK